MAGDPTPIPLSLWVVAFCVLQVMKLILISEAFYLNDLMILDAIASLAPQAFVVLMAFVGKNTSSEDTQIAGDARFGKVLAG